MWLGGRVRLHFLQRWCDLSDPAAEEALYDLMNAYLASRGLQVKGGTIVDATIIAAPSSTKNQTETRDPEMQQTRKGRQWYFGMKLHVGADSKTKLIHSMTTTAASVHDANVLGQ